MRNTIAYPTQQSSSHSRGIPCSHKRGNDDRVTAVLTLSPGMVEMLSLNTLVQRLKVAILPLDLPRSGPVTHSGEILTTGTSHRKKWDRFSLNDNMGVENVAGSGQSCTKTARISKGHRTILVCLPVKMKHNLYYA